MLRSTPNGPLAAWGWPSNGLPEHRSSRRLSRAVRRAYASNRRHHVGLLRPVRHHRRSSRCRVRALSKGPSVVLPCRSRFVGAVPSKGGASRCSPPALSTCGFRGGPARRVCVLRRQPAARLLPVSALDRWAGALAGWAIPPEILRTHREPPWASRLRCSGAQRGGIPAD